MPRLSPAPLTRLALLATFLAATCVALRPSEARPSLRVGYAEADINPPLGVSMPGYFSDRRGAGTLDPLKSKVLYLRQGDRRVALVSTDLLWVDAPTVQRIRAAVSARIKPAPHVWVHGTHTHTGGKIAWGGITSDAKEIHPSIEIGTVDEGWVTQFVERTADAVVRASSTTHHEADLSLHEGREATVAHYRRFWMKDGTVRTNPGRGNPEVVRPAGEIDPRLHLLRFAENRIVFATYSLHPDCVSGNHYSADYPSHLSERIREELGPKWRVIYFNAACGNINHIDVKNRKQKSGPEESRRIGRVLGEAALEALQGPNLLKGDELRASSTKITSRLRRPKPEELALAEERIRTGGTLIEFNGLFAPATLVLGKTKDTEHSAEVAAMRLGSFGLAFVPAEYFVELAREIEAASPFKPTRTVGLTNGAMGYVPHREGYAQSGYEATYQSARYEPDTGHNWAAAAAKLLTEMR